MVSNAHMYRSFLSKSFVHICRYGRAYLIQLPCWQYPFIIGPHYLGVLFTIGVILGGAMMNRNAVHTAELKKSISDSTASSLQSFVFCMTCITISLLVLTATTEPGIVYNQNVLKALNKEHLKQRRTCCAGLGSGGRHRDEDLGGNATLTRRIRTSVKDDEQERDDDDDDIESAQMIDMGDEYSSSEGSTEEEGAVDTAGDRVTFDAEMSLHSRSTNEHQMWRLKNLPYCSICKVLTPEEKDIMHCHECGFCIEKMDHHCPWMGQCVGKRNMKWFALFNMSWIIFLAEFLYLVFAVL